MKFGAKRTTPVVWTEIQFKFWHWVSTLQATTPQPGPLFIPKQYRRTSFMIYDTKLSFPGFEKYTWWRLIFHLFGTPFADFLSGKWAKMGYLAKYCSVLPHFCCNDNFYWNVDKNDTNQDSGWWDMREWWWKIGFTPRAITHWSPSWQHSSSGAISNLWVLSLIVANNCCQSRPPYSIHISKPPLFGASDDHLCQIANDDPKYVNTFLWLKQANMCVPYWHVLIPHPSKKELFLPCPHQSAPLSIYNLVLAAPIRRGKMPSEPHQGTQRCIP